MRLDDIKESALMAVDTLRANKLRSTLTILGVSVGVLTVIFMVSIIQGLNKAFADQIESLGSNTIFVSKFEPSFGRPPGPDEIHRKDLTMDDAEALRNEAPSVVGVSRATSKTPLIRSLIAANAAVLEVIFRQGAGDAIMAVD